MSKEESQVEPSSTPEVDSSQAEDVFLTWNGRTFKSQDELKGFMDGLANSQGRNAQKADELSRKLEPFQKYNLDAVEADEAAMLKKVKELREEDRHDEADAILFNFSKESQRQISLEREKDRLWNDYVRSNPDMAEVLDPDIYKDYLFRNYTDVLAKEENPLGLIDRVLRPKVARLLDKVKKPSNDSEVDDIEGTLGAGQVSGPKPKSSSKEVSSKEEESSAWDKMLDEFGVE